MDFFEKEMREMFEGSELLKDAIYCGKMMIARLDDKLRVKLVFVRGAMNNYEGIKMFLLNRWEGEMDKQHFPFSDIIGYREIDGENERPFISDYGLDSEWNFPISSEEKQQIADKILNYIGMFAEPVMEMRM